MKKRDYWVLTGLCLCLIILDQLTKAYIVEVNPHIETSFFSIKLLKNLGLIGGSFTSLPPKILQISISTIGFLVVCLFFSVQYFLSKRILLFRIGLSLAFSGVFGNLLDKIFRGYVVDFIGLGSNYYFNLADVFQWPGIFIILYFILFKNNDFWPDKDQRGRIWIHRYQKHFLNVSLVTHLGLGLLLWTGGFTYLRVILEQAKTTEEFAKDILINFSLVCGLIYFSFALFLIWFSGKESHRIIGPIFAFKRFIHSYTTKPHETQKLRLRSKDHLKELEEISETLLKNSQKG